MNDCDKLQNEFMTIINRMVTIKCELPKELPFYYNVKKENCQIYITPYLTKDNALRSCRWYDSDDSSNEDETVIYREQVNKADFKIIRPLKIII